MCDVHSAYLETSLSCVRTLLRMMLSWLPSSPSVPLGPVRGQTGGRERGEEGVVGKEGELKVSVQAER